MAGSYGRQCTCWFKKGRMNTVIILLCVLLGLLFSCGGRALTPSEREELEVYLTVLSNTTGGRVGIHNYVSDETMASGTLENPTESCRATDPREKAMLGQMLNAYKIGQARPTHSLVGLLSTESPYTLVHPNADNTKAVSNIFFNPSHDHALVYSAQTTAGYRNTFGWMALEKNNNRWLIDNGIQCNSVINR